MKPIATLFLISILFITSACNQGSESNEMNIESRKLNVLILDGQNNHGVFPKTTMMMKDYLEESGLFAVQIYRTKYIWQGPHHNEIDGVDSIKQLLDMYPIDQETEFVSVDEPQSDDSFRPDFNAYDVVVANFGWRTAEWSSEVKQNFESYMRDGGGLVVVHAANNAFGDWKAYNEMIGLGGWGGRNTESGPYVYYDDDGERVDNAEEGPCGSHGAQLEFVVTTRASDHPIMKGLPTEWLHTRDELYERLRGPAKNMTVLATAYSDKPVDEINSDPNKGRTGRHEPMLMAIEYAKGRVFHTALGHMDYSQECVGYITTMLRGTEWAATGEVTQDIPTDFPSVESTSIRPYTK